MSVQDTQCAVHVADFGSRSIDTSLSVVQGIISFLSIVGSVLLILSYVLLRPLRSKSRLLITHLAAANFLTVLPNFLAVFMDFRGRFKVQSSSVPASQATSGPAVNAVGFNLTEELSNLSCSGNTPLFDNSASVYCNLCVYLEFINHIGTLSTIFWTVCVCIHFFILVSYRNTKLASQLAYVYYVIAWLAPLGICLWLLFHNWFGFEPTYSTVSCGIRTRCVPYHHPYHYQNSYSKTNWNRIIGVLFGIKIWQILAFLIIPCLFVAIKCKNRKHRSQTGYRLFSSSPIRNVERKILLIPIIFMLIFIANFVSDLYFFIHHKKNLKNLNSSDGGIIFVHFLARVCDNSQGVINFCLFCLFTKKTRSATIHAVKRFCHCQYATATPSPWPEISELTVDTSRTRTTSSYGAIINSREHGNLMAESSILN